jgi:hypothetical protein
MSTEDGAMLDQLRTMWEAVDPPPDDLVLRTLFLLELDNVEFELMSLREALTADGARGVETASTITFASESLTIMVTVSGSGQRRRLDGWIAPSAALRIELRTTTGVREGVADADGRFVFTDVPSGLVQLVVHPTGGAAVRLVRPVATPAMNL